jgi:hypothetical protein
MEIINFVFSAENVHTLFLFVAIIGCAFWLRISLVDKLVSKEELADFHKKLKENDFAHLENTIKALTFMLEKNKFLTVEDKNFIDSHLEN